ncbi:SpoIIE family protein phosphatase [Candidatus Sumerlaeota bacterium]|nr:SpoIIE family protein phosphatase [Candidatus Sumerlaeota bacterium]
MPQFIITAGPGQGQRFEIQKPLISIGRSPSNTLTLNDKRMSRFHAEVVQRDGKYYIRDLGSKNGTLVNQKPVRQEMPLCYGDEIEFGEIILTFCQSESESRPPREATVILDNSSWGSLRKEVPAQIKIPTTLAELQTRFNKSKQEPDAVASHRLDVLSKVLEGIRSILDLNELLGAVLDSVMQVFKPDRGVILLYDKSGKNLEPRSQRNIDGVSDDFAISRTIVDQAIEKKASVLVADTKLDDRFNVAQSIIQSSIRTAICSPLICKDDVEGALYIDTQSRLLSYNEGDLDLLNNIAGLAAVSIANARLHEHMVQQAKMQQELEIASQIQRTLICHEIPQPQGFEIAAATLSAREVGGDFYDFIPIGDSHLGVTLADVSGKGVPAAILASSLRSALQVKARDSRQDIKEIIQDINRMTYRDTMENMFATLFFAIIDIEQKTMNFINAGHDAPFLLTPDGQVRELEAGGTVVGIFEDTLWDSDQALLPPGSALAIFSDGVTDIRNAKGEMFDRNRLQKVLQKSLTLTAHQIMERVSEQAFEFKGDAAQFDDFTLMIIKSLPAANDFQEQQETETIEHKALRQ